MDETSDREHRPHRRAFGDQVRSLRETAGLSQEALAERANIHRTYVSSVERGQRNLGLDNIVALARALRAPVGELFRSIDRNESEDPVE